MAEAHKGWFVAGCVFLLLLCDSHARIHKLTLMNETRSVIDLNNFGFFVNGTLEVKLSALRVQESLVNYSLQPVGFSLSRSRVNGVLSYTAEETELCPLTLTKLTNDEPLILFLIDIHSLRVKVNAMGVQDNILISKAAGDGGQRKARDVSTTDKPSNSDAKTLKPSEQEQQTKKPKEAQNITKPVVLKKDNVTEENLKSDAKDLEATTFHLDGRTQPSLALDKINTTYAFSFRIVIGSKAEGLYSLKFHYCQNRVPRFRLPYSFTVQVTEKNPDGFLSAAEIPLSRLYICMAAVFFAAAMVWVYTLMKHRYSVFKIHWLMAALAFTKSISLVFHSINYHFINTEGHPIEGWAVMYYITHLLKGALLFITLALIGTGWAFVKYILSDKEKKIFMIVIPLQVLANVAYIIIESTEEGSSEYNLWKEILFLVDLICCGAILFPVVWSIRHLQEASNTDGKAAMNLEKLKLFRHYYVMIVCYIYFTRIIAILLKITMPFQWQWCYEFLVEVSTLIFFVLTGYKFRPASNNPYLQLPQDEDDVEADEVVTESGALEGISKVKKTSNGRERQKESTL
ncbi:protein GPR108 [Gouania willdenowi]|uniref:GOST seven transmembrane domain-containing protein n=1 Tax=Gouania willdenowi TaxID=441366 RepID=A0A8C5HVS4_GOUWI|nr:protein GPR108 [Gouania willdenowi]